MKYVISDNAREITAIRYFGDLASLRKIAEFAELEPHDIYHVATDWGVQCTLKPKDQDPVRLYPGNYLVKASDGKLFSMPMEGFNRVFQEVTDDE